MDAGCLLVREASDDKREHLTFTRRESRVSSVQRNTLRSFQPLRGGSKWPANTVQSNLVDSFGNANQDPNSGWFRSAISISVFSNVKAVLAGGPSGNLLGPPPVLRRLVFNCKRSQGSARGLQPVLQSSTFPCRVTAPLPRISRSLL
jgi:hypothetical protein